MVSYPNKISSTPVCNILNDCSLKKFKSHFSSMRAAELRVIILNEGTWNLECCFDDQSSIRIDRIFCSQSFNGFEWVLAELWSILWLTNQHSNLMTSQFYCCCCLQWANFECCVSVLWKLISLKPDKIARNSQRRSFMFFMHFHTRK